MNVAWSCTLLWTTQTTPMALTFRLALPLLAACALVLLAPAAATSNADSIRQNANASMAGMGSGAAKRHRHVPRMDPALQLNPGTQGVAAAAMVMPLLPDCVPKYVTDLVLPPPMPLARGQLDPPAQSNNGNGNNGRKLLHGAQHHSDDATAEGRQYDDEAAEGRQHGNKGPASKQAAALQGPRARQQGNSGNNRRSQYQISVRQISQQVLPVNSTSGPQCPASLGATDVLAYGPAGIRGNPYHNWPGFTIEAQSGVPTTIKWTNDVKDASGNFLPHILRDTIDQTIHWANPARIGGSTDSSPCESCRMTNNCASNAACSSAINTTYNGPVPIVTHVHGQEYVYDWSDGYAEAWFLPDARGVQGNYAPAGTWYNTFRAGYEATTRRTWTRGSATFVYNNTNRPSALWYHDHTVGLTRTNVYSGLAGFYLTRDKFPSSANGPELPGLPFPAYDGAIAPSAVRELPLAIQDRAFTTTGSLYYPVSGLTSPPALPSGEVPNRWVPEFSATVPVNGVDTNMLMFAVNGRTYPRHAVAPDAYRLRLLNGCNARTMQLKFARSSVGQINPLTDPLDLLQFWVVGNEGGFYPQLQAPVTSLQMGPAERYDVVIDFSGVAPGEFVFMLNNGPETDTAIYDGTNNGQGLTVHTSQIMRFDVAALATGQTAQPFDAAQQAVLNAALQSQWAATVPPLVTTTYPIRRVALMERQTPEGLPIAVLLGVATGPTSAVPTLWADPVASNSALVQLQVWDIINLSADSHPIHLHNVDFRFLGRFATTVQTTDPWTFTQDEGSPVANADLDPQLLMPCASDPSGVCAVPKDTILVLPGSTTRIAFFGPPSQGGLYVWHCHLVEHEDNEMMVPHCFGNVPYPDPRRPNQTMCPGPN